MNSDIRWPLQFNVIRRNSESNTYGMVRHHKDGSPKPHQGWDFAAKLGTACLAVGSGKVEFSGYHGDFGLMVVHSFVTGSVKYYAAYAHLQSTSLKKGDSVTKGQEIARTGNSGNASSLPYADLHLHFEVRTTPMPGLGLAGRVSPIKVFHVCPLKHAVVSN